MKPPLVETPSGMETAKVKRELRKEPRRPAKGLATICRQGAVTTEICGRLVDVSKSGFRMAHTDTMLEPGQTVAFYHKEASGQARVMWNRIINGQVESGFLIVEGK
ncbi:MAG: hypothetical protein ABI811_02295 [Acidobacteriota bacterium]